jgi:hypothetical protein
MLVGKQKAVFRIKITEVDTNKSKTITLYHGKQKKTVEQLYSEIIDYLRSKS